MEEVEDVRATIEPFTDRILPSLPAASLSDEQKAAAAACDTEESLEVLWDVLNVFPRLGTELYFRRLHGTSLESSAVEILRNYFDINETQIRSCPELLSDFATIFAGETDSLYPRVCYLIRKRRQ